MTTISRSFKGIWISAEVWLDRRLTYFERCLYAEIHSLDGVDGCYASNEYLCDFFQERERKIQEGISKLKALGYISVKSFDGRTRILKSNEYPQNDKSLFNTSEVRKPSCDKSLFNTSGVLESAPLSYIYNKEDNKEQQQRNAADVSDVEKEKAKKDFTQHNIHDQPKGKSSLVKSIKTYVCLENIEIPQNDKVEITSRYNEDVVKNATRWATHEQNPPTKCLAASIKYACRMGFCEAEFDKKKETHFEKIVRFFKHGEKYNEAECYLNAESITFQRGMKYGSVKLDKFFSWNKLEDLCNSFKIPFARIA